MKKNKNWLLLSLNLLITMACVLLLTILLETTFMIGNYGWDDLEHWASSWFIFNGFAPYRDFFQHHHPLLWYITAPFFWFMEHPIDSFRVGRIIAVIFFCGGCFLIGKIVQALGGTARSFLYALFIYLSYPVMAGNYFQNRPDTYMTFFLLWGLYKWIVFLKNKKTKDLVWCYLFYFIAFAFLQKAIWFLFPFGLYQIYLLIKKEMKWSDLFKALIIPIFITLGYGIYLTLSGSLIRYFELNWILNMRYYRSYYTYDYDVLDYAYTGMYITFALSGIVFGKKLIRQLSCVALGFGLIFYLMPKPYGFYWTIFTPFAAIVIGLGLVNLTQSQSLLKRSLSIGILVLACFLTGLDLFTNALFVLDSPFEDETKQLSQRIKYDNELVGYGDYRAPFFRNYPEHYYWFTLCRGALYDSQLFHRHQMPAWDKIVYEQKPKFVMYHEIYDVTDTDDNNTDKQILKLDEDWLLKNYHYIKSLDVFERID